MDKIKINKKADEIIIVVSRLAKMNGISSQEILDNIMEEYKKTEGKKLFTADETDAIIQLLRSMPGYTPEKFYTLLRILHRFGDFFEETLGFQLYVSYIMLSIINPELFEETNND